MNQRVASELARAIGRFVDGEDQSARQASEIEGLVVEWCQVQDWFESISEALALFVPGGGSRYLDETQLVVELRPLLAVLSAEVDDVE